MKKPQVVVSGEVGARPQTVYDVLSDYRNGHPHILPSKYFTGLEVLEGGKGAGTVVQSTMRALGTTVEYRLEVEEPEPGKVLLERDPAAFVSTWFTVTPVDDGDRSRVEIATEWSRGGLRGALERIMNPPMARRIYRQELRQLDEYVRARESSATATP